MLNYWLVVGTIFWHLPQIALNRFEAVERLEEAMSTILINIAHAQFYVSIYEDSLETNEASDTFKDDVENAMPHFYAAVLVFSAKARAYIEPTKTGT